MHLLYIETLCVVFIFRQDNVPVFILLRMLFFSHRCPFHVEYQTFAPEMEFMHDLL